MAKISACILMALLLIHMSGCAFVRLPSDKPEEFTNKTRELRSIVGSTSDSVKERLGEPKWVMHLEDRQYYIYQWRSAEVAVLFVGIVPTPIGGSEDGDELHCILLGLSGDGTVNFYKTKTTGQTYRRYSDCVDVFGLWTPNATYDITLSREEEREIEKQKERLVNLRTKAEEGDPESQLQIYWNDPKDINALNWLCRAADQGNSEARYRLGILYETGSEGIAIDTLMAYMWYRLAESTGDYMRASDQAKRLREKQTKEQKEQAEELYQEWKPGQCEVKLLENVPLTND